MDSIIVVITVKNLLSAFFTLLIAQSTQCKRIIALLLCISAATGCSIPRRHIFKQAGRTNYFYFEQGSDESQARRSQISTVLPDGKILLLGGTQDDPTAPVGSNNFDINSFRRAELFDPATETTEVLSSSPYSLGSSSMKLLNLPKSKVLITSESIGDSWGNYCECNHEPTDQLREVCNKTTALLFDSGTGSYASRFNIVPVRSGDTQTLIPHEQILILGGTAGKKDLSLLPPSGSTLGRFATIQVYDPVRDSISAVGKIPFTIEWSGLTATLLDPDRVLLIGGVQLKPGTRYKGQYVPFYSKDVYIYSISQDQFTIVGQINHSREGHRTVPLGGQKFLLVSGTNTKRTDGASGGERVDELEVFDLETGKSTDAGTFTEGTTAIPVSLPDNRILLLTGTKIGLFDPSSRTLQDLGALLVPRYGFGTAKTANGDVYIFGGRDRDSTVREIEKFDYAAFKESEKRSVKH